MMQTSHFTSLEEFLSKRRIFPWKNQSTTYSTSGNQPLSSVSNAVTTRNASKKRKILEIDDRVEDVEGVEDIHSQSGSETLHPNTKPIGEAEKLTNFRLPPIGERESPSSPLSIVSSTRQTTLLL